LLLRLNGPWLLSADGLRDLSERQRTLRGAIGRSYDLLPPVEPSLFTRLAVFVGGCTLEAAELLCGDALSPPLPLPLSPAQVLDGIASLLDKNLLHREVGLYGEPRYAMLETVREYGLERLSESGEEAPVQERYARCFLRILDKADQTEINPRKLQQNRLIDDEIHNVRAALAWAMERDVQSALVLTAYLVYWYHLRGPYVEGARLVDEVLALPGASAPTIPRAMVLYETGILKLHSGEQIVAQASLEESLVLSQELGYLRGEAVASIGLARMALWWLHDQRAGGKHLERALACYRELHDSGGISMTLMFFTKLAMFQGDFDRALELAEENLSLVQQAGLRFTWPLVRLGEIACANGDFNRARSLFEQSLVIEQKSGTNDVSQETLIGLSLTAIRQKDLGAAYVFLDRWLQRVKKKGYDHDPNLCGCYLYQATLLQEEGDYEGAILRYRASLPGVKVDRDEWGVWGVGLADLAFRLDCHELAALVLSATEATDGEDYSLWPIYRTDCVRLASAVRPRLSAESFDAAWTEGRERPFEQVIEEAVSILEAALNVQPQTTPA